MNIKKSWVEIVRGKLLVYHYVYYVCFITSKSLNLFWIIFKQLMIIDNKSLIFYKGKQC